MSDVFTDTSVLTNLVETAYDREVALAQHSEPFFRQAITTKKAANQAMPGDVVTFSIGQDIAAATTPLTEDSDVSTVALAAPTRVSVTLEEYGNAALTTLKLNNVAFVSVDGEKVRQISYNMADSIDLIVRGVLDGGTQKIYVNATNVKITGGAEGSVAAGDVISSKLVRTVVTKFRKDSVRSPKGMTYPVFIDPDVSADLQGETGAGGWRTPKEYVDGQAIYVGEIGTYLGASFVETPRCAVAADGAAGVDVYTTYFMGNDAVCEAGPLEPHVVVGPQTDHLKRFYTLGWLALKGCSLYRPKNLWLAKTASNVVA